MSRSEAERLAERVTRLEKLILAIVRTMEETDNYWQTEISNKIRWIGEDDNESLQGLLEQIWMDMKRSEKTGQV